MVIPSMPGYGYSGKPTTPGWGPDRIARADNITLFWLTNTAVSSARIDWENKSAFFAPKHVAIPAAFSAFPDEVF